jgi:hypothetical protein
MDAIVEEPVVAKIYPGLKETPEFRGMLFISHIMTSSTDETQSDFDTIFETRTACAQEQYFGLLVNLFRYSGMNVGLFNSACAIVFLYL